MLAYHSDLWQVRSFLRVLTISSTNKTDPHDITEILLKVALSNITLTLTHYKNKIKKLIQQTMKHVILIICAIYSSEPSLFVFFNIELNLLDIVHSYCPLMENKRPRFV